MLARIGDVVVITSPVSREEITSMLPHIPEKTSLRFEYVDVPRIGRRWTPSPRHQRLRYFLWQVAALRTARVMQRDGRFDLAWHLTLASAWFGSIAALVGVPSVYGPVGGGTKTPLRLLPGIGLKGSCYELARSLFHAIERYLNPLGRASLRRACLILVQNRETLGQLPKRYRAKAEIFSNAVLDDPSTVPSPPRAPTSMTAVFSGELRAFKGVCFAIRALVGQPEWRLVVCGTGPDEQRLRRLARRLEVDTQVSFRGWIQREELLNLLREEAHVFVFPSLHEEAGMAVAEALACGLAVICVDQGGPPVLAAEAGRVLSLGSPRGLTRQLTAALGATTSQEQDAAYRRAKELSLDTKAAELRNLLAARLVLPRNSNPVGRVTAEYDE
jgi:glycosyltransferase involved in cell wall biosynthesis